MPQPGQCAHDALLQLQGQDVATVLAQQAPPIPLQPVPQPATDVGLLQLQMLSQPLLAHKGCAPIAGAPTTPMTRRVFQEQQEQHE